MLVYHTEEPRFILFEIVFDNSGVLVLGLKASHLHKKSKKKKNVSNTLQEYI